jgi:hypothetical protein
MEESQLRQVILGKLRDQTLPRDASFANTIPAFFESTHKGVVIYGVASRNGKNRTLAANPVSLKSMDWLINRQKKPNSALF